MKKLSAFQITLLAVFGALAVAGVLIFAFAVGGGGAKSLGPVTIWGTLDSTAFQTVLRQVADQDSSFNQVSYVQKDATTYQQDLTDALASGKGPDLFLMTDDYAVQDADKVTVIPFQSLSQSQFQNTFVEAANPFIGSTGILSIPLVADPLVLYWNKDLFASAGLSQPPAYWDELFGMAQKLTQKSDAGSILKSAIDFGEFGNVDHAKDILATLILQAGGQITAADATGHLQSQLIPKGTGGSASQTVVSALRFYTEFADPSKDDYSWNRSLPNAQSAFASGDLAMYVGYASEEQTIARMNPNLNFSAAPMPQIRSGARAVDIARVYGLAAPKTGANPSSALAVAYTLSGSVNAQALSTALGLPPVRRDLLSAQVSGEATLLNRMVIMSRTWSDPDPSGTDAIFRSMIEDTTSGAMLINEAVSRADQQLTHILSQLQENQ